MFASFRDCLPALLALAALGILSACDVVRTPWDDGPPPSVPKPPEPLPPGAPGPPPPTEPVNDPYGLGESGEINDAPIPDDPDTPGGTDSGAPTDETQTDPNAGNSDETDAANGPENPLPPAEPVFSYYAPGALLPGSGQGNTDQIVHAPGMTFPIAGAPAYLQSQVFTFGGGIGGGDQCDVRNFSYPWRDNFCETRSRNRNSPFCPNAKIHQGQDIRVGTPSDCVALRQTTPANRTLHRVVAVEDGTISHIGSYSVNLRAGGRIYKYMHMNMAALQVEKYDTVKAGDLIGYVSNDFGGAATTLHLHFEIVQNTADSGWVPVPPYLSLVEAYERRENGLGQRIEPADVAVSSAPIVIPDGFEIIE